MGSKLFREHEIKELVLSEGWALSLLDWTKRAELALKLLEKLKVVEEKMVHRLEVYNYPETRMLAVAQLSGGINKSDVPLGSVEINEHMTLSDLRSVIAHELDRDIIPKAYRFMYKANPCAARQEGFRKAWETLPKVTLLARLPRQGEIKTEEKDAANVKKDQRYKLLRSQRRLNKKLVPVPIFTLVRVQEDSPNVNALHDIREWIQPGDVIRIGHINARDYIVPQMDEISFEMRPPKAFLIEPSFDMINEEDAPFQGNTPLMNHETLRPLTANSDKKKSVAFSNIDSVESPKSSARSVNEGQHTSEDSNLNHHKTEGDLSPNLLNNETLQDIMPSAERQNESLNENFTIEDLEAKAHAKAATKKVAGNVWADMWIWKCIPRSEDARPKWRQMYDDGLVPYVFEYQNRVDGPKYFRVQVQWRLMESLCRDSRCPDLSFYRQRVDEMAIITLDHYTQLVFNQICNWYPQMIEFIDINKFIKLMKDIKLFPDMKRPARMNQLEQVFQKEVKTFGLAERYATYAGFCRVLQHVALIKFPYGRNIHGSSNNDDASSMHSSKQERGKPSNNRVSLSSLKKNEDDVSVSSKGTVLGKVQAPARRSRSASGNRSRSPSNRGKGAKRSRSPRRNRPTVSNADQNIELDPAHASAAYGKLVTDYLMLVPEWSSLVWAEAKLVHFK